MGAHAACSLVDPPPVLTSSLYQHASSEVLEDPTEARRRLRATLKRLVAIHGAEEVRRRVRGQKVSKDLEGTKAWILLNLWEF